MDIKQLYSGAEKEAFYPKVKLNSIEDTVNGKTIEQNLQDLNTYNTQITNLGDKLKTLNATVYGTSTGTDSGTYAIDTVPEVYSFLNGYLKNTTLRDVINDIPIPGSSDKGSVVNISGTYNTGTKLATITIDGTQYNINIPSSIIQQQESSLSLQFDSTTNELKLFKGGVLQSIITLPFDAGFDSDRPDAPTFFNAVYNNASGLNNIAINLQWAAVNGCDGYKIYRNVDNNGYELIFTETNSDQTRYVDTDITIGSSYTYYIVSYIETGNKVSDAIYSQSVTATLRVDPPVLTNVTYDPTNSRVIIEWGLLSEVQYYKVYRNGTYLATSTSNIYLDSTISSNTTYTYEVSAVLAEVESAKSGGISVSTTQPDTPLSIGGFGFIDQLTEGPDYYIMANPTNANYTAYVNLPQGVNPNATVSFNFNGNVKAGTPIVQNGSSLRSTATFNAQDFVKDTYAPGSVTGNNVLTVTVSYGYGLSVTESRNYIIYYPIYHGYALHPDEFGPGIGVSYYADSLISSNNIYNAGRSDVILSDIIFRLPSTTNTQFKSYYLLIPANMGTPQQFYNLDSNDSMTYEFSLYRFDNQNHSSMTKNGIEYNIYVSNTEFNSTTLNPAFPIRIKANSIIY